MRRRFHSLIFRYRSPLAARSGAIPPGHAPLQAPWDDLRGRRGPRKEPRATPNRPAGPIPPLRKAPWDRPSRPWEAPWGRSGGAGRPKGGNRPARGHRSPSGAPRPWPSGHRPWDPAPSRGRPRAAGQTPWGVREPSPGTRPELPKRQRTAPSGRRGRPMACANAPAMGRRGPWEAVRTAGADPSAWGVTAHGAMGKRRLVAIDESISQICVTRHQGAPRRSDLRSGPRTPGKWFVEFILDLSLPNPDSPLLYAGVTGR